MAFCLKQVLDGDVTRTRNFYFIITTSYWATRIAFNYFHAHYFYLRMYHLCNKTAFICELQQTIQTATAGSVLLSVAVICHGLQEECSCKAVTATIWKPSRRIKRVTLYKEQRFLLTSTRHQLRVLKKIHVFKTLYERMIKNKYLADTFLQHRAALPFR